MTIACDVVLCCRVTPVQKQEIVALVKKAIPSSITLAIGDGANDVNMITEAHVGVGIKGVEGQQAARAADYAIGEFKILKRLLFFHGRENYRRNAKLVLYNFYKNTLLNFPNVWFGFFNYYSGQEIYEQTGPLLFNLFFASGPIIIYALFDRETVDTVLLKNPKYYAIGLYNMISSTFRFFLWLAWGIVFSLIISALA